MLLEGVDILLSATMPENAVFCTYGPRGLVIRVWYYMDEGDILEALIRELTEITIEATLKSLGYLKKPKPVKFKNIEVDIPQIFTRMSLGQSFHESYEEEFWR